MKNRNLYYLFQIWTNWKLTPSRLIYLNSPVETAKNIESRINDREQKEEKKEKFIDDEENIPVLTTEINDKIDQCSLSETYKIKAKVKLSDTLNKRNQELSDIFMMNEFAIQREVNILNKELADFKDQLAKEKTGQDIFLILTEEIGLRYSFSPASQYQRALNLILEDACANSTENMTKIQSDFFSDFSVENIKKKLIDGKIILSEEIKKQDPNEAEKQLSAIEFKELTTQEDYENLTAQLSKLDVSIRRLGWTEKKFYLEKAQKILTNFKQKLEKALILEKKQTKDFSDPDIRINYYSILQDLLNDIADFEQGNLFRRIKYEEISTEGLETKDVKTVYKKYGLTTETVVNFIKKNVSTALIYDYYSAGLLQENFYKFIEYGISIEMLKKFLSLFSLKEQAKYFDHITRQDVASALNTEIEPEFISSVIKEGLHELSGYEDIGTMIDREKVGKYYPYLLWKTGQNERGDPEYEYDTNLFFLLKISNIEEDQMTKAERTDPIPIAKQYQALGLNSEKTLIAMQVPELTVENIKALMRKYQGIFTSSDIFEAVTEKIDLDKVKIFYENVLLEERELTRLKYLAQFNTEKVIPYLKLIKKKHTWETNNDQEAILYFIKNSISSEQVKEFQDLGIIQLSDIQELLENKINAESLKIILAAGIDLKKINISQIREWHKENFDISQIKLIYDLVQENKLPPVSLYSENIKKYQSLIDSAEKKQNLLDFFTANFFIHEAFYAIENNIGLEEAKKMKEDGLYIQDFEKNKKYNLSEFSVLFKAKNENMYWYDLKRIIKLLDLNYPREKIKKLIELDLLVDAEYIAKQNDDIGKYLPYREFINIFTEINRFEAIGYFIFFDITPETLKKYDTGQSWTGANVNRIIMTEYQKNNGKNHILIFLHHLSIITRVPLKALEKMKTGYELPEEQVKPTAVVILPKSDWNSGFEREDGKEIYESMLAGYNVYFYEADSDKQFADTVASFGQDLAKKNKKIDMMLIGGHGRKTGIQFADLDGSYSPSMSREQLNDAEELDLTDADLLQGLDQYLSKDAKIILQSCSTGQGGASADNIASSISKSFGGRQVFAPNKPTNIDSIRYNEQGLVEGVNYADKDTEEKIQMKN